MPALVVNFLSTVRPFTLVVMVTNCAPGYIRTEMVLEKEPTWVYFSWWWWESLTRCFLGRSVRKWLSPCWISTRQNTTSPTPSFLTRAPLPTYVLRQRWISLLAFLSLLHWTLCISQASWRMTPCMSALLLTQKVYLTISRFIKQKDGYLSLSFQESISHGALPCILQCRFPSRIIFL